MNAERVAAIAGAVLYEGYILYPYRPSALKNQQRFNFGVLAPRDDDEARSGGAAWAMQIECLVGLAGLKPGATPEGVSDASLSVRVRFLHLVSRALEPARSTADCRPPDATWQEAVERDILVQTSVGGLHVEAVRQFFVCAAHPRSPEASASGLALTKPDAEATMTYDHEQICGEVQVSATRVADGISKITVRVNNVTPTRDRGASSRQAGLMRSMVSTHALLHLSSGEFISLLDPPAELTSVAASCQNIGAWPVLVGDEGERDTMLASPIVLYDYPQIAPESAGDFFDGTEIDEMLVLRILTMTDQEKEEMRAGDPRARRLLEQTETLPQEHLMKLHGVLRGLRAT